MSAIQVLLLQDVIFPASGLKGQMFHLHLFNHWTSETWHKNLNNQQQNEARKIQQRVNHMHQRENNGQAASTGVKVQASSSFLSTIFSFFKQWAALFESTTAFGAAVHLPHALCPGHCLSWVQCLCKRKVLCLCSFWCGQVPSAGGHMWDIWSGLFCKMRETTVKQTAASQKSSALSQPTCTTLLNESNASLWHHDATLSHTFFGAFCPEWCKTTDGIRNYIFAVRVPALFVLFSVF